jgi:hypothetical protein
MMRKLVTRTRCLLLLLIVLVFTVGCRALPGASVSVSPAAGVVSVPGLSSEEVATLSSLEQVDDYPLYTMHYHGAYDQGTAAVGRENGWVGTSPSGPDATAVTISPPAWACSLFAALGDRDNALYGRNFDWEYSPALLLFTDPPDGYASVSMVDIAYLGFAGSGVSGLTDLPLVDRASLLAAPLLPFDGMNERGLAVGMAAVPPGHMQPDPDKETIGSLLVIRRMLDYASNVDEAVEIIRSYNVDMQGGPPIHYLVADPSGRAALVEFHQGKMVVTYNDNAWHLATNFLRASVGESAEGECWRYDKINQRLAKAQGQVGPHEAMDLLGKVSQAGTQWSVVYGMSSGDVNVAMGREYDTVHTLALELAGK